MSYCLDWREEKGDGHCRCYLDGRCCYCGSSANPVTDPSGGGQSTAALTEPVVVAGEVELTVVEVGIKVSVNCHDVAVGKTVSHQVTLEGSPAAVASLAAHLYRKIKIVLPPVVEEKGG